MDNRSRAFLLAVAIFASLLAIMTAPNHPTLTQLLMIAMICCVLATYIVDRQ